MQYPLNWIKKKFCIKSNNIAFFCLSWLTWYQSTFNNRWLTAFVPIQFSEYFTKLSTWYWHNDFKFNPSKRTRRVKKSLQSSYFFLHGCIYTKVAASTSNMNLCLSCHVTWTVLHTRLHYGISILRQCILFTACKIEKWGAWIVQPGLGLLLHILLHLQNKSMEYGNFWNAYKPINFLLCGTLFDSYFW